MWCRVRYRVSGIASSRMRYQSVPRCVVRGQVYMSTYLRRVSGPVALSSSVAFTMRKKREVRLTLPVDQFWFRTLSF